MAPKGRSALVGWLVGAAVIVAAALALWWTGAWEYVWGLFSDRERLRQAVEGAGPLAPAMFVLLLVAQAVLAPLPAPALAFAGGYLFGTFWGFVLTWLGALLGGVLCFWISRSLGRGYVARSTRLQGLDRRVEEHGAVIVFVLRLIPLISFDAISYAAGLTGISFGRFFAATALGMAPGTFVFVYLGGTPPGPGIYAALAGLAVLAVLAYAYYRRLK
ncbi:MAG: TVP38/TMEM64 family protein [Actinomycetota bacterium]|nr:TVP38/TMEM64 family protein [Actinomycetota bacterium]